MLAKDLTMLAPWVADEMKTAELHDKRLNQRLCVILNALAQHPTASLPAACGGRAELEAAYRFFDNEKTTFDKVLQPHFEATRRRMAAQKVVLFVQDTTEVDLTRPQQQVLGAGPLDGSNRRGAFLHPLHAFAPDGTPLGTVAAEAWAREEDDPSLTAEDKRRQRKAAPIEEKESLRWLTGLRQARDEAVRLPGVQCICVADSEADIYEVLAEPTGEACKVDWIIRACQDRALVSEAEDAGNLLRARVLASPVLFTQLIHVRGRESKVSCEKRARRQPRESREATVEVRAAQVILRPPSRPDRELPETTVNVVLVSEVNPPPDDVPVEWLLLTTLPIENAEQVRTAIQYYHSRWMIEILFRTLKSGCRVEERRFEHLDRLLPCLAVYLIVAWRTVYVCRLGRSCPEINCEAIFEPSEWQAVYQVVKREPPPKTPPKLGEFIRLVAQLGGYVNRPRKDPPGPQTVWLGLQRAYDFALAWEMFGPGAKQ
jgi:hypothetical protein